MRQAPPRLEMHEHDSTKTMNYFKKQSFLKECEKLNENISAENLNEKKCVKIAVKQHSCIDCGEHGSEGTVI